MKPNVIHKIELAIPITDANLPWAAVVRHVAVQRGRLTLWYEFNEEFIQELRPRRFIVVGTGHESISIDWSFIGTVLMNQETLVLHIYEASQR